MTRPGGGVPALRVRAANDRPLRPGGAYVLYWMTAFRRAGWNFALERAVEHAGSLGKPLLVLEALRCDYRWASDRLHAFVLAGMADNGRALERAGVAYLPYVEPSPGAGRGLLAALAARACVVVADDAPVFFLPRALAAAAARLPVRLEAVDSNGLLPLAATERVFATAFAFRRFLQAELPAQLERLPAADPLAGAALPRPAGLPDEVARRWPPAPAALLAGGAAALAALPLDHAVAPVPGARGGSSAGRDRLARFVAERLPGYPEARNHPDDGGGSGLSPWLHFGHVSAHEAFAAVAAREGWARERLAAKPGGRRAGWWGMSEAAEAFLDQLVTWRELGFNFAAHRDDGERYEGLPGWALATLARHAADPRPQLYTVEQLAAARTHDPLWNACQTQLVREGTIHGYLRMLWGKKVLEWSPSPAAAFAALVELNDRWALDGRDPNSAAGIAWCLGRYDRPWGPERPIFGTVRYMSSANAARKLRLRAYLARWGDEAGGAGYPA
jgi:deoxyribodipyrimidine photo-lyase